MIWECLHHAPDPKCSQRGNPLRGNNKTGKTPITLHQHSMHAMDVMVWPGCRVHWFSPSCLCWSLFTVVHQHQAGVSLCIDPCSTGSSWKIKLYITLQLTAQCNFRYFICKFSRTYVRKLLSITETVFLSWQTFEEGSAPRAERTSPNLLPYLSVMSLCRPLTWMQKLCWMTYKWYQIQQRNTDCKTYIR